MWLNSSFSSLLSGVDNKSAARNRHLYRLLCVYIHEKVFYYYFH